MLLWTLNLPQEAEAHEAPPGLNADYLTGTYSDAPTDVDQVFVPSSITDTFVGLDGNDNSPLPTYVTGINGVDLTFSAENAGSTRRHEVMTAMVVFPQTTIGLRTIDELRRYHVQASSSIQTSMIGDGVVATFSGTLSWTTAAQGTAKVRTVRVRTVLDAGGGNYIKVDAVDNGSGVISGTGIQTGAITYSTGAIAVTFTYPVNSGEGVEVTFDFTSPITYPTDWTILQRWPTGAIKRAKAWFGASDGTGAVLPARVGNEPTRVIYKLVDDITKRDLLPTYAEHSEVASLLASGTLTSTITDRNLNQYLVNMIATPSELDTLESTAWGKVRRYRSYHAPLNTSASTLDRDMFSLTWYLATYHNHRRVDIEVRLGNDYLGSDATTIVRSVVFVGDGVTTHFNTTIEGVHATAGLLGQLVRGRCVLTYNGIAYTDTTLDVDDSIGYFENCPLLTASSINYVTGVVDLEFASPIDDGDNVTLAANTALHTLYEGNGTSFTGASLPYKLNQHSVYIWNAAFQLRDDGRGQLVPYTYTKIENSQRFTGNGVLTTFTGTLGQTNIVRSTLRVRVGDSPNSILWTRDLGDGTFLATTGVVAGSCTINYSTGDITLVFSTPIVSGIGIYVDFGYTATAHITGTVNYGTGAITVSSPSSVTGPILGTAVTNPLAPTEDPNLSPLGSMPFYTWTVGTDTAQVTDYRIEGQESYKSVVKVSGSARTMYLASQDFVDVTNYIPPGGYNADLTEGESLKDGASIARFISLYCGTGAASQDTNSFAAFKVNRAIVLPTLDTLRKTEAQGLVEGAPRWVSAVPLTPTVVRTTATESLARRPRGTTWNAYRDERSLTASVLGGFWAGSQPGLFGYSTQIVAPEINAISSQANDYGTRGTLRYWENYPVAENSILSRQGHWHTAIAYYAQSSIAATYFYHAALYQFVRPGATLWKYSPGYQWEDSLSYRRISEVGGDGLIPSGLLTHPRHYRRTNQQGHGRSYRKAFGAGLASVTSGSPTVYLTHGQGDSASSLPSWFTSYEVTASGATTSAGLRRVVFAGYQGTYRVTAVAYSQSQSQWVITLDRNFVGTTAASIPFAASNDPETGIDQIDPRLDVRDYIRARVGVWLPAVQHGITAEPSSYPSTDTAHEAWEFTGSWLLLDRVRQNGDYWLAHFKNNNPATSVKDVANQELGHFLANAAALKSILAAYQVTKELDSSSAARFLSWLTNRHQWWLDTSAKGYADSSPKGNQLTKLGGAKPRDCKVAIRSGTRWGDAWRVGPQTESRGWFPEFQNQLLSEVQQDWSEDGFGYSPIWAVSFHLTYLWAAYRELRLTTGSVPANLLRICEGTTNFVLDYGVVRGETHPIDTSREASLVLPPALAPGYIAPNNTIQAVVNAHGFLDAAARTAQANGWTVVNGLGDYRTETRVSYPVPVDLSDVSTQTLPMQAWDVRCGTATVLRGYNPGVGADPLVDTMGWPIPGSQRGPTGRSTGANPQITSFELGAPHPGQSALGGYQVVGGVPNDPNNYRYPSYRSPYRLETYYLWGHRAEVGQPTRWNASLAPALALASRFHSSSTRRTAAHSIIKHWAYSAIARTVLRGTLNGVAVEATGLKFEYEDRLLGPIQGAVFQDLTRWWNTSFRYRRRIVATSTTHSAYSGDQDVLSVSINSITGQVRSGFEDVRVIYQDASGSYDVKFAIRVGLNGPTLFFKPYVNHVADEPYATESFAYYVYYGSPSAVGVSLWDNTESIDGPFASDANTLVLWNQDGSIYNDAGPSGSPLLTLTGYEPVATDGPFGQGLALERDPPSGGGTNPVTFNTVNAANFTPFQRKEVALATLALPDGYIDDTNKGTKRIWARDPMLDGNDYAVEWYQFGPKRPNGSYKNIRAYVPVTIGAGLARGVGGRTDNLPYEYYLLRQIEFYTSSDTTAITAWSQHANVDLSPTFINLTFAVKAARRVFVDALDAGGGPGSPITVTTRHSHCYITGDKVELVDGTNAATNVYPEYTATYVGPFTLLIDTLSYWNSQQIGTGNGSTSPQLVDGSYAALTTVRPIESAGSGSRNYTLRNDNRTIGTGDGTTDPVMANGFGYSTGTTRLPYFPVLPGSVVMTVTTSSGALTIVDSGEASPGVGNLIVQGVGTIVGTVTYFDGYVRNVRMPSTVPIGNLLVCTAYRGGNSLELKYTDAGGNVIRAIDDPTTGGSQDIGVANNTTVPTIRTMRLIRAPVRPGSLRVLATLDSGATSGAIVDVSYGNGTVGRLVNTIGRDVGQVIYATGEFITTPAAGQTNVGPFMQFESPLRSGTAITSTWATSAGTLRDAAGSPYGIVDYNAKRVTIIPFPVAVPSSNAVTLDWRTQSVTSNVYLRHAASVTPSIQKAFTLDAAALRNPDTGAVIATPRASLELDATPAVGTTSQKWVKAYRIPVRIYPEYDGSGDKDQHPASWGNLYIDVPSNASGCGRFVKFWFEMSLGLVRDDYYTYSAGFASRYQQTVSPVPIKPGTFRIHRRNIRKDQVLNISDNGSGLLTGTGIDPAGANTIDYTTGRIDVSLLSNSAIAAVIFEWVYNTDETPRSPWTAWSLHEIPTLTVVGPETIVENDQMDKPYTPSSTYDTPTNKFTTVIPMRTVLPTANASIISETMMDGDHRYVEGAMIFHGGPALTGLDADTRSAMRHVGGAPTAKRGYQVSLTPVIADWLTYQDNVVPFGALPPNPDVVDGVPITAARAFEEAGKYCYDDLYAAFLRDPYITYPRHGLQTRPPSPGSQPDFGHLKFHYIYTTGFPDVRGAKLYALRELIRYNAFRDSTNVTFNPSTRTRHTVTGYSPSMLTAAIFYDSRPIGSTGEADAHNHGLGSFMRTGQSYKVPDFPGDGELINNFARIDNLHFSKNTVVASIHLCPNRFNIHSVLEDVKAITISTFPDARIPTVRGGTGGTWAQNGTPRDEGRVAQTVAQVYWLTGDQRAVDWCAARALWTWIYAQQGSAYAPVTYGQTGSGSVTFHGDMGSGRPLRIPYTEGADARGLIAEQLTGPFTMIWIAGWYACYRVLQNDQSRPESVTGLDAALNNIRSAGGDFLVRGLADSSIINAELDRRSYPIDRPYRHPGNISWMHWFSPYIYTYRNALDPEERGSPVVSYFIPYGLPSNGSYVHDAITDPIAFRISNILPNVPSGSTTVYIDGYHGVGTAQSITVTISDVLLATGGSSLLNGTRAATYDTVGNYNRIIITGIVAESNWNGTSGRIIAPVNYAYAYSRGSGDQWNRWSMGGLMAAAELTRGLATEYDTAIRQKLVDNPIFPPATYRASRAANGSLINIFGEAGDNNWYSWVLMPDPWDRWATGPSAVGTYDVIYRPYADAQFAPPSDFSISLQLRLKLRNWVLHTDRDTWPVLSSVSVAPTPQDPFEVYIERSTRDLVARFNLSGVVREVRIAGPSYNGTIYTSNGSSTSLAFSASSTVVAGTLALADDDGIYNLTDDGFGAIIGDSSVTGTIDYVTGDITLVLTAPLALNTVIAASWIASGTRWKHSRYQHVRYSYSASTGNIIAYVDKTQAATTAATGNLIRVTNANAQVRIGSIPDPDSLHIPLDVAEVRIAKDTARVIRKVDDSADMTVQAQQTLALAVGVSAPVSAFVGLTGFSALASMSAAVSVAREESAPCSAYVVVLFGMLNAPTEAAVGVPTETAADIVAAVGQVTSTQAAVSAAVQYPRSESANVSSYVVQNMSAQSPVAAVVQLLQSTEAVVSAFVVKTELGISSAKIEAVVQLAGSATASIAARVITAREESASIVSAIGLPMTEQALVRSAVGIPAQTAAPVAASVSWQRSESASIDAVVRLAFASISPVSSAVAQFRQIDVPVTAFVGFASNREALAIVQASVSLPRQASVPVEAVVYTPYSSVAVVAATVATRGSSDAIVSASVNVSSARSATAVVAATVAANATASAEVAAVVQIARSATASVQAYVVAAERTSQATIAAHVVVPGTAESPVSAHVVVISELASPVSSFVAIAGYASAPIEAMVATSLQRASCDATAYVVSMFEAAMAVSAYVAVPVLRSTQAYVFAYVVTSDDLLTGEVRED